jgi:deoxyribodipyrimidine photo-lyase
MNNVPKVRIRSLHDASGNAKGDYVWYWMVAVRRPHYNFALDRAVELCQKYGRPLLVMEPLRCGYRWASDRLHRFVLQGMANNQATFAESGVTYLPYVEHKAGDGSGMLEALAERACAVVTDDYPCFFLPDMFAAVAPRLPVTMELVDSNGLLPLRATERTFPTAYAFRRFLQKELPPHLLATPNASLPSLSVLKGAKVPEKVSAQWPQATPALLQATPEALAAIAIDHSVKPAAFDGGHVAAGAALDLFLNERLPRYSEDRNHPDREGASELSPYLHFGHVSVHDMFARLTEQEKWHVGQQSSLTRGAREGWWNMSACAEAFLDEIITWRELGYNMSAHRPDYAEYNSLPDWAKKTLDEHRGDPREELYSHEELEHAQTKDPLWNAAQNQLVRYGRLHNYMRMLWGKKILQWSATPEAAVRVLIDLNNKYGVDGRDPNSYSGIFWCFGRFDRPWPERQIFGKIRYMTSESTRRKFNVKGYIDQYK